MPSTKPTVLVTRRLPEAVERRLSRDYDARLNPADELIQPDALPALAQDADALLVTPTERLDAAALARLPLSIRAIATFSVGYDHIDVAAARARSLLVTNTPDVLTDATADVAILLMLGAARRAHEGERLVRENRWGAWAPTGMLGTHMTGKRLAVLGMGRIGRAVARHARGFDMTVHYSNRRRLPADLEAGAIFHADPDELLRHADFLSLHCPATAETARLLDSRRIALLPEGAIVVNTARGGIVDDEALITALRSGRIAAAGLDVYEGEPCIHPGYRDLANTFLLPHLGSATRETRDAMGFRALDNLDAVFAGREPPDRVV
ncbi:MAG: D-glycerate dehydrogenase [Proteobacteria bacterium]|nr:D-glycerate dehydrogenase [Pseudomonadota bacterium]MBI3495783.1 D-glycerate dehydrogenase [Pseudomonadota bacterium]